MIEDNQLNLELATDLLEAHGFTVFQAHSAEEGLQLARVAMPDIVLMDLGLPGLDGLSATQNLKADPATAHISVVALTAHAMRGDDHLAAAAGCDGYFTKPIDTRTFAGRVGEFIAAAQARRTAPFNNVQLSH